MQFFRIIFSLAVVSMLATACGDAYKSTKSGLVYKIIPGSKKGKQVKAGTVVKFHVVVMQKDSVTYNSFGKIPAFAYVDSTPRNYDISEVLPLLNIGDSAVIVQSVDTIAKLQGGQMPAGLKKGDKIKILLRVLDAYDNIPIAQLMYNKENELQKERDIKEVEAYLNSKKIRTIKTPAGAFVAISRQGEGALPDTGKQVSLKYTGFNFNGDKFDSNVDPAFGHTDTFKIVIGQMGSIPGFEEGVKQIAKGGKAKIYIPSMLGYGMQGAAPKIKPYEHLIFEVEMLDIQDVEKLAPTKKEKE
ncbi:MAG: FKBP-type peptidyl-prolyl cis-trans isomerase [Bacteroidetes bacterium]|nr:FKBP-type peptidyl-prolyl cis-trans isomerase [Bacteroidota bacterium]